jgi:hypothetical protein
MLPLDCREKWCMAFDFHPSQYSSTELAAIAAIVLSVAAIAYFLFAIWVTP